MRFLFHPYNCRLNEATIAWKLLHALQWFLFVFSIHEPSCRCRSQWSDMICTWIYLQLSGSQSSQDLAHTSARPIGILNEFNTTAFLKVLMFKFCPLCYFTSVCSANKTSAACLDPSSVAPPFWSYFGDFITSESREDRRCPYSSLMGNSFICAATLSN